jgi:hypothetical protein
MRKLLALVLLLCSVNATADSVDERLQLARRLVATMDIYVGSFNWGGLCVQTPETIAKNLSDAYHKDPGSFHGVSPQSAYWPEVEQIWRDYYVGRCAARTGESPPEVMAKSYAASMSLAELRDTVAFVESDGGRGFFTASRQAARDLEASLKRRDNDETDKASLAFKMAMRKLKAKYEVDPR